MKTSGVVAVLFAVPVLAIPAAAQETGRGAAADPCASPTIVGTGKADRLLGTPGPDVIDGRGGRDKIQGRGGGDILCGGEGADLMLGGPGNDQLYGGRDQEVEDLEDGNYYWGDSLAGGPGDDLLDVGDDPRTSDVQDVLDFGSSAAGVVVDLPGGTATGDGSDVIVGPVQSVKGSDHADHIIGTDLGEDLEPGRGADIVEAGGGEDWVIVGETVRNYEDQGGNVIDGGAGDDSISGGGPGDRFIGGEGDDFLGGRGAREILGGPGRDTLHDELRWHAPGTFDGGPGLDSLTINAPREWRGTDAAVLAGRLDLAAGTAWFRSSSRSMRLTTPGLENATIESVGRWTVTGTAGRNVLYVHSFDGGRAVLIGGAGDDELSGTPRGDVFRGGSGQDAAWGRGGRDRFASIERRLP